MKEKEMPVFDKKFKTIVECCYDASYMEKVDWLNNNSLGAVDVKLLSSQTPIAMVVAFEDEADALIFRIRYS